MAENINFDPGKVFVYRGAGSVPKNVVHAEVHSSVDIVPEGLFEDCRRLASVLLRRGVRKIGKFAFRRCFSLRSFRSPPTVVDIGMGAFHGCAGLEEAVLNRGLERIGPGAFRQCSSLEHVQVPASVARIGEYAFFNCTALESAGLRPGLVMIGASAFEGCSSLESVRVPSTVMEIGSEAFQNCMRLASVRLDERLPTMGWFVFRACLSLESFQFVHLSERMRTIRLDDRTRAMFEERLREMTNAMAQLQDNHWEKCKRHLELAHEVLTHLELKGSVPLLELALWKAQIDVERGGRAQEGIVGDERRGENQEDAVPRETQRSVPLSNFDARPQPSREECRVKCGSDVVIAEALKFFAYRPSWPGLSLQFEYAHG